MKNKVFVPVPVSERLPKKYGAYIVVYGPYRRFVEFNERTSHDAWRKNFQYWIEEREDRTAELVDVLKGLVYDVDNLLGDYDIEWQQAGYLAEAKLLITSIAKGETK